MNGEALPATRMLENKTATAADIESLYLAYSSRVYNFMRYRVTDSYAEDLTQMVFERVLSRIKSYNPDKGSAEVWIFTIARNILYDHYRKARRMVCADGELKTNLPASDAAPETSLLAGEERAALKRALGTLNKRELTAVSLKYAGGLRNTEIADVLGISEKNAGVIICRALKKLKSALERKMTL
jgi:RNA polymerase sigma-70 factor (ECF subfamily)